MRISRALALFRPSVLASMMNLTEDDLIFTEKCLQRTLLVKKGKLGYLEREKEIRLTCVVRNMKN